MHIPTWFGIFTTEHDTIINAEIFQKDLQAIVKRLLDEKLLLRGNICGCDLCDLALEYGFVASTAEYDALLHELNLMLAKEQIAQTVTPQRRIIAGVEAIDDLNKTGNMLSERLKEWYMLNFENTYFKGEELARRIIRMEEPEKADDLTIMKSFSANLIALYETRNQIEEYLKEKMPDIAPNLTVITGHILGARLLSIAGSLERLACMPSSTIQVIGANNALFKHLSGKAPCPKHGIIFRHPLINTAPRWQRGKIAKVLASKISLAARYDVYSGKLKDNISRELMMKVELIRKRTKAVQRDSQKNNL